MRELKVRRWYFRDTDNKWICWHFRLEDIVEYDGYGGEYDEYIWEQYTGLKDKNGKEIYEGDIVNITAIVEADDSDMTCIIDTNSTVCWDKEHARWDVNDKPESKDWDYRRRRYFAFVNSEDRENVEIIGNIHENPELLEENK